MHFSGKALYNLLKINWKKNRSMPVEAWQVEDYRALSREELFARLKKYELSLNEESFKLYAETCDSPEELLESLWLQDDDLVSRDQVYLLLFELWRQLLPEKRSLSIFCDDLDLAIEAYAEDPLQAEEQVQELLHEMGAILDENVDLGVDAKALFTAIEDSCAHNIESFLYDYTVDQIASNNDLGASEVLDGFYPYINDLRWFDFLRARLFALTSLEEATLMICGLLEQLEEDPDLDLLLEIASYLATSGDPELFAQVIRQGIDSIDTSEDLTDLLELIAEYHLCLDQDKQVEKVRQLIHRSDAHLEEDKKKVMQHLQDADWSKI